MRCTDCEKSCRRWSAMSSPTGTGRATIACAGPREPERRPTTNHDTPCRAPLAALPPCSSPSPGGRGHKAPSRRAWKRLRMSLCGAGRPDGDRPARAGSAASWPLPFAGNTSSTMDGTGAGDAAVTARRTPPNRRRPHGTAACSGRRGRSFFPRTGRVDGLQYRDVVVGARLTEGDVLAVPQRPLDLRHQIGAAQALAGSVRRGPAVRRSGPGLPRRSFRRTTPPGTAGPRPLLTCSGHVSFNGNRVSLCNLPEHGGRLYRRPPSPAIFWSRVMMPCVPCPSAASRA